MKPIALLAISLLPIISFATPDNSTDTTTTNRASAVIAFNSASNAVDGTLDVIARVVSHIRKPEPPKATGYSVPKPPPSDNSSTAISAFEGTTDHPVFPSLGMDFAEKDGRQPVQTPQAAPPQATPPQADQNSNGRALPSPLPSPPFPDSDWLGFPNIGAPYSGSPDYPLEKALTGNSWLKNNYELYGWLNPSFNLSTSEHSNQPLSYDLFPNHLALDQAVLMSERQPDTVQTSHVDWGYRSVNLYGTNYRYTIMQGVFSDQLLKRNQLYGFDPVEFYGIVYFPKVAEGLWVRAGRYISPPDIEAQLTPDNYLYSHSLMFTVDPYTFMGVNAMLRLNKQWEIMFQFDGGNDMAIWERASSPNFGLMARWVSKDGNDGLWGGINSIGAGKVIDYHDDLQQFVETWGHRFNARFHMMTEFYYMWEYGAYMGGTPSFGPVASYGGGGGPGPYIRGKSEAEGLVNYFQELLDSKDYLSLRTDFLNDPEGYRTGYRTLYFSETLGWVHDFTPMFSIRPEIRWEHAFNASPYDNGAKRTQMELAADLILRF